MPLLTLARLLCHCFFCARMCLCFCSAPLVIPLEVLSVSVQHVRNLTHMTGLPPPELCWDTTEVSTTLPYETHLRALWNVCAYMVRVRLLMCGYKQQYAVDSLWLLWGPRLCVRECWENFEKCCLWKIAQNIPIRKAARNGNSASVCTNISRI